MDPRYDAIIHFDRANERFDRGITNGVFSIDGWFHLAVSASVSLNFLYSSISGWQQMSEIPVFARLARSRVDETAKASCRTAYYLKWYVCQEKSRSYYGGIAATHFVDRSRNGCTHGEWRIPTKRNAPNGWDKCEWTGGKREARWIFLREESTSDSWKKLSLSLIFWKT